MHLTGYQPAQWPPGGGKLGDEDADEHDHDDASGSGDLDASEGDGGQDACGNLHGGHDAAAHHKQRLAALPANQLALCEAMQETWTQAHPRGHFLSTGWPAECLCYHPHDWQAACMASVRVGPHLSRT